MGDIDGVSVGVLSEISRESTVGIIGGEPERVLGKGDRKQAWVHGDIECVTAGVLYARHLRCKP